MKLRPASGTAQALLFGIFAGLALGLPIGFLAGFGLLGGVVFAIFIATLASHGFLRELMSDSEGDAGEDQTIRKLNGWVTAVQGGAVVVILVADSFTWDVIALAGSILAAVVSVLIPALRD